MTSPRFDSLQIGRERQVAVERNGWRDEAIGMPAQIRPERESWRQPQTQLKTCNDIVPSAVVWPEVTP